MGRRRQKKQLQRAQKRATAAVRAESRQARALTLVFASTELELSQELQRALIGDTLAHTKGRARAQRKAMDLVARLRTDYRERLVGVIESAYGEGAKLAGKRPRSQITRYAVASLAEAASARLDSALSAVGRQVDDVYRQAGLEAAARQLGRELPQPAATKLLEDRLRDQGLQAFTDKAGRRWTLQAYSAMVIRTTLAEAVAQGTADAILAAGRDTVRFSDHNCNHHPGDPAHPCVTHEGGTYSLTGATPDVPLLDVLPPFHPNCTHVMVPAPGGATGVTLSERLAVPLSAAKLAREATA